MPRRKRDVKESADALRKRPRREVQDGETVVVSDSDDEDGDFLPTLPSREGRRRDRERKSPSNAGMTEEQMLDLAVRLSEQEASKAALRLRQEEEAVRKAIEESLCGDLTSSHPTSQSLCPPSQGWIPQGDHLEFTTMQPTRRKLSYPNHRASREAAAGASSSCVEEDQDGGEKRRRNEGSMLMEMPDLSQTQKLCTQPSASPSASPSTSPPSQKYGTSQRTLLEDLSCGSTPQNCDPASPVFPSSKPPPASSPVLCIPRLSHNLLADYGSSGFLLCSQPGASEGTLFSSLKSPVFPASPDHRFSKTEGSVLRKAHGPRFPVTCSPSSSGSDRTTIPRSPVLSKTDCVTLFESDGEEEAETQIVPDCPKSPVFPSSRPITDKDTRRAISHPPSSANEKRGEEDSLTCPTHKSSEVNNRAPPTQCLSQSRTSLSLKRRRTLKASQPEDIPDQDKMSPDVVGQEEEEKEEEQEEVSRAEGESLQELASDMVLRWSEEEEEEEGDVAKLPSALSPSPVFPQEDLSPQLNTQEPPPQPSHRPRPPSPSHSCVSHAPGPSLDPGPGPPGPSLDPGPGPSLDPGSPGPSLDPGPGPSLEPGPGPSLDPGPRPPGPSLDPGPGPPGPSLDPGPGPSPHKRPLADSNSQGASQAKRPRRKFTYRGMYVAGAPSPSQSSCQPEATGASHLQARGPSGQTSTPREEQGGGGAVRYYWGVPFCPQGQDPDTYTQVILAQLEVYEKSLKEAQRTLLRKAEWGEAILPGPPDTASSRPGRRRRPHAPRLPEEEEEEEEEEERGAGKRKETEEEEVEVEVVEDEEEGEKAGEERGRRGWGWKESDTLLLSSPELEEKSPSPVFRESRQTPPLRRRGLRRGERGASHTPAAPVEEERRTIEEGGKERRGEEDEQDLGGSDVCPETQLSDDDRTQDLMVTSPAQPQPQPVLPQPQREAVGGEEEGMEVEVDGEVGIVPSRGQDVGMEDEKEEEEEDGQGQGGSRRGGDPDPPRMECPMCMQLFPLGEIEMHAAYCDGAPGGALEDMDTQEESQGSVKARRKRTRRGEMVGGEQPSSLACSSNSRPPPPREKCFLCQKLFPVRDYERHVEQCIHHQQQQQASRPGQSGTLLSALDQTESKDHAGRAGVGSCDLSFRSSVLTERRGEGGPGDSGEERPGTGLQVSTSPIRSFTSISEATDCLIDFKHQYNSTKLSRGGRGGGGGGRGGGRRRANRR